ncbi:MAG: hypothetical protein IAE99_08060 [Rhodothermales bacterium]|nr:hypothetical protein [Rhodothermales bacterium]
MQITKINIRTTSKKVVTTIEWEAAPPDLTPGNTPPVLETYRLKSEDEPHPDLLEDLQALRWAFSEVCAMEEAWCEGLSVNAVSSTLTEDGRRVWNVTATKDVGYEAEEFEMTLTTPFFSPSGDLLDDVMAACSEARLYVKGKRRQLRLFDDAATGDGQSTDYAPGETAMTMTVLDADGTPIAGPFDAAPLGRRQAEA